MSGRLCFALIAAVVVLETAFAVAGASGAPGDLDPTFGSGGVIQVLPGEESTFATGVAVGADDAIVIGGSEAPGNVVLLRLLPNGELDPAFGAGGKVVTPFPGGFSEARSVAIQDDGKIVIAGTAKGTTDADFLIARYNADGSPDPSFGGGDGATILPVGSGADGAEAVALGPGGKIVAVGRSKAGEKDVAGVAVLLSDGMPDTGFAADGTTTVETPVGDDSGEAVSVLADGRILIGDSNGSGGGYGFTLVQLLPTSAPDPSFGGGDGIVVTPIPNEQPSGLGGRLVDLTRAGDGRIVTSGYGFDITGGTPGHDSKVTAVKYLAGGELDPSFGSAGIFSRQLEGEDTARTVDVAEGDKVLLAGEYDDPASGTRAPAVLRLVPGGDLDPGFGAGGVVERGQTAPFGEGVENAAVDSLDRLVTVGLAYGPNNTSWVTVTRYLGDHEPATAAPPNQAPHARMRKVRRKLAAARLKGFFGTASDPDGDQLARVQVAVVKLVHGGARASRRTRRRKCFVLKNAKARFKRVRTKRGKRCPQRWLTVKGKAKWRFRLKRRLPAGRYVVYARAVDARGLAESSFSRKAGNRYAFRIKRH